MTEEAIKLLNAGGVNNYVCTVETRGSTTMLTYVLTVCGSKLRRKYGTTQGITIFNSDDNNKRQLLPRSIVEVYNFLSLLVLDKTSAAT